MTMRKWMLTFWFFLAAGLSAQWLVAVASSALPTADGEGGISRVRGWATDRVRQGEIEFSNTNTNRLGSPFFWGDEVVYSIQVDRFNDGDPTNNLNNLEKFQIDQQFKSQAGLENYKHGGDLQGIIHRLDYLAKLGVTSLWITPILQGNGSYHGYCTSDFTKIDSSFGDLATLQKLTREAHKRGIRIILDIVVNHMCNNNTSYDNETTPFEDWAYAMCVDDLNAKMWSGAGSVRGQRKLNFSADFFAPLRNENFFNRCGNKSGDFATGGNGAIYGDFSPTMFDFDTMNWDFQDIFTELHKYWIAAADIDGFRVDAAKHVSPDFLAKFSTEIRSYANSLGKNNFLLVGEVAANGYEQALRLGKMRANYKNPDDNSSTNVPQTLRSRLKNLLNSYLVHPMWPLPGLNAVYDFAHSGQAVEMLRQNKSPMAIKSWYWEGAETQNAKCSAEYCEIVGNADARLSWNVLEIHDWPRFAIFGASQEQLTTALQYLLSAKGTPVIYYGAEQGFNGQCVEDSLQIADSKVRNEILQGVCQDASFMNHSRYRQNMFASGIWRLGSNVPSVQDLAGIGWKMQPMSGSFTLENWQKDPFLQTDHKVFTNLQKAIAVRKSCESLRRGEIYFRAAHDSSQGGLLAFSRIYEGNEVLVLLNTSPSWLALNQLIIDASINLTMNAKWRNLYDSSEFGFVGTQQGATVLNFVKQGEPGLPNSQQFALAPNSLAIFVDEQNIQESKDHPDLAVCRK